MRPVCRLSVRPSVWLRLYRGLVRSDDGVYCTSLSQNIAPRCSRMTLTLPPHLRPHTGHQSVNQFIYYLALQTHLSTSAMDRYADKTWLRHGITVILSLMTTERQCRQYQTAHISEWTDCWSSNVSYFPTIVRWGDIMLSTSYKPLVCRSGVMGMLTVSAQV